MTTATDAQPKSAPASDARRKRLGQFFTGVDLSRLLAALAATQNAGTVIDPMVGTGDMLVGCLEHGATPERLAGIEIDPTALSACRLRITELGLDRITTTVLGSAFDATSLEALPTRCWDAVITNPPYVRYQTGSQTSIGEQGLPTASEVRSNLFNAVDQLEALCEGDRDTLRTLTRAYSGLADLAVPSWLLCAGLVREGGTLGMLVPTTWLTREYAHPVQYLLARWFEIQCVVEDTDATWFPDALVRTTLVVAKRTPSRPSAFQPRRKGGYLHINLSASLSDERSLVGSVYPKEKSPDACFACDLDRWRASRRIPASVGVAHHWVPASHMTSVLQHAIANHDWAVALEPTTRRPKQAGTSITREMQLALGRKPRSHQTIDAIGWQVGQGLRTGANQFFYGTLSDDGSTVEVTPILGGAQIELDNALMAAAVRRQADLPSTLTVRSTETRGRVFLLNSCALPEDLEVHPQAPCAVMPHDLSEYIRRAADCNVGSSETPKFIPDLSAVAPNAREANSVRGVTPRFWYQLPPLTDRHRPALFIPRVNSGHPTTYINQNRETVIDANFTTLWPTPETRVSESALFAFLHSSWCAAAFETSGTVLGGGALKVEAAHVRRLAIPNFSDGEWRALDRCGAQLSCASGETLDDVRREIDGIVATSQQADDLLTPRLTSLARSRLVARSR